jgi:hypothetical protein
MYRLARSSLNIVLLACGCSGQAAQPPAKPTAALIAKPTGDAVAVLAAVPAPSAPLQRAASPPAPPSESPGYAETMGRLRPPAAASALQALVAAPSDAQAYAQATLAYASTEVPAMALIWGMTYQALGGGKDDAVVASVLAKVLSEHVVYKRDTEADRADYNLRLAPGQMPARQHADGSVQAPLAHVFEGFFGTMVMGYRPPWTIAQFYDSVSNWAGVVSAHETPLDEKLELNAWLVTTAKGGHLEAYCHQLLGPAFAPELKAYKAANGSAFRAYKDYLKGSAIKPTRAVLPDDLVVVK